RLNRHALCSPSSLGREILDRRDLLCQAVQPGLIEIVDEFQCRRRLLLKEYELPTRFLFKVATRKFVAAQQRLPIDSATFFLSHDIADPLLDIPDRIFLLVARILNCATVAN